MTPTATKRNTARRLPERRPPGDGAAHRRGAWLLALALLACGHCEGGGGGGGGPGPAPAQVAPLLGDYAVVFEGRVGGPYEPSGSIVSGTTTGVVPFQLAGTVTLAPSQPGVVAVPPGTTIPGVAPADVIFGAAVMQNPLHVFLGTPEATRAGDFGCHSMVEIGLPGGPEVLPYTGCQEGVGGPFSCVPTFFHATDATGGSVNLVYFVVSVTGNADGSTTLQGLLVDRHTAEAAANLFTVPITGPITGDTMDTFVFDAGATFDLTISGAALSGTLRGAGVSAAGLVPQRAILEASFQGTRR